MRGRIIGTGVAAAVLAAGAAAVVVSRSAGPAAEPTAARAAPAAATAEPLTTIASAPPPAEPPSVQTRIDRIALPATLPPRGTRPFSMLSVNWTDPSVAPRGTIQVRTRSARTGRWSGWQDLTVTQARADLPVERNRTPGATEPYWAGRSTGVAARIAGAASAGLPAGLRLNLIDPDAPAGGRGGGEPVGDPTAPAADPAGSPGPAAGTDTPTPEPPGTPPVTTPATEAPPATAAPPSPPPVTAAPVPTGSTPVPAPTATGPVRAQLPSYVSRAGWKADESIVKVDELRVAPQAKMVWVHHTGFRPDYTCAESASIIRGIQANDVRNDQFSDIGYNFLVDKCGTLFEGRRGGVTAAVVGAHSVGFNTGSVGVALLGDYTSVAPSEAALTTIAQLSAARLGAYGFSPTSTAQMTANEPGRIWPVGSTVTFPRISGHKDGQRTAAGYLTVCPGAKLYPLLPSIRARSVQMITGLVVKSLGGGVSTGGTVYVRSAVTLSWTVDTPSAQITRFELLRDGVVAAKLAGSARSGSVALTPGTHTVAVRAVHTSGGTAVTPARRVIADVTAPAVVAPAPALRGGTYAATAVPVTAHYRATDNVRLWAVTATSPARVPLSATATHWQATMRPGANTRFTVTARDVPGNARTASVTRRATIMAETSAKRGGSWTNRSGSAYLSGRALAATRKGAKLTYTFTGRSAALLFSRATGTGKADVYLDGKKVATVDTRAGKTAYRQAVWVRSLSAQRHTVTVVVAGTKGRPTVVSDGLAYIG